MAFAEEPALAGSPQGVIGCGDGWHRCDGLAQMYGDGRYLRTYWPEASQRCQPSQPRRQCGERLDRHLNLVSQLICIFGGGGHFNG